MVSLLIKLSLMLTIILIIIWNLFALKIVFEKDLSKKEKLLNISTIIILIEIILITFAITMLFMT